jgi:hypothetical protein
MIMDDYSTKNSGGVVFSEMHGAAAADIDGDGVQAVAARQKKTSN